MHGTLGWVHGMLAWVTHKLVWVDDRQVLECNTHSLLQISSIDPPYAGLE